CQQHHTYPYNF
nr:immunoglobulin light chain junction region [Macaca mulatta]MOW73814.1 immunoglobulin light chain junction region [Macaca mulatta]